VSGVPGILGFLDLSGFQGGDQPPYRVIDPQSANIIAEVTLEEDGLDQLTIVEHPVEQSAAIADHCYRRPRELRIRAGWSNAYGGSPTYAEQIYTTLVGLQWQRRPFQVFTGKQFYENMLIAELRVSTNSGLEFATIADIFFREVLLVNTQIVPGGVPNNASQLADPASNQPTVNGGQANTTPVTLAAGGALPLAATPGSTIASGSGAASGVGPYPTDGLTAGGALPLAAQPGAPAGIMPPPSTTGFPALSPNMSYDQYVAQTP
jgi:hypothetical protein